MNLVDIKQNCEDDAWLQALGDVDFAVLIAKAILLNNRVQQFDAADVVKVAEILLAQREKEIGQV